MKDMQLLCITSEGVWVGSEEVPVAYPESNQVYTFQKQMVHNGIVYIELAEIPGEWWEAKWFTPLISDDQLEKMLYTTQFTL